MFKRDPDTGALINTDDSHYRAILAEREARRKQAESDKRLSSLEAQLAEIREMLKTKG